MNNYRKIEKWTQLVIGASMLSYGLEKVHDGLGLVAAGALLLIGWMASELLDAYKAEIEEQRKKGNKE